MVLSFLVSWMPHASFALRVVNNHGQPFDLRLATVGSCLYKASTIIYILLNKQVASFTDLNPFIGSKITLYSINSIQVVLNLNRMANKTEHVSINLNLSLTRAVVSSSGGFENIEVACAILRGKKLTYD